MNIDILCSLYLKGQQVVAHKLRMTFTLLNDCKNEDTVLR